MGLTAKGKIVSADLPISLWEKVEALCNANPGLARQTLLKAMLSVALAEPEKIREHIGRY